MTVLVSACLTGVNCKYSGGNNLCPALMEYLRDKVVISVCPEVLGGLSTPRIPCEIVEGRVMNREGEDLDQAFREGGERILRALGDMRIDLAILQARSPSCGAGKIYDGSFSGKLKDGDGVFAAMLRARGVPIIASDVWVSSLGREESENA